jgi:hypothetical protein
MINHLSSPQIQPKDGLRPSSGSVGVARPAGAVPPVASSEMGPANPRMRIDRDLGMVVIEFRDSAGRVSVSLPTPREIEAYRAAILFGADVPYDLKPIATSANSPSAARPGIPMPTEVETPAIARPEVEAPPPPALNKIA